MISRGITLDDFIGFFRNSDLDLDCDDYHILLVITRHGRQWVRAVDGWMRVEMVASCSVFIIQSELATEVINILARERERARLLGSTGVYFSFCWTPHYWKYFQEC